MEGFAVGTGQRRILDHGNFRVGITLDNIAREAAAFGQFPCIGLSGIGVSEWDGSPARVRDLNARAGCRAIRLWRFRFCRKAESRLAENGAYSDNYASGNK